MYDVEKPYMQREGKALHRPPMKFNVCKFIDAIVNPLHGDRPLC